jgi:hypothetical protein
MLDNPNLLEMDPQDRAKQLLGMTNQVLDKLGWPVREPTPTR